MTINVEIGRAGKPCKSRMKKNDIKIIFAYIFLFGQIPILLSTWFYFGLEPINALILNLLWASAILCGFYCHWVTKFMKKETKNPGVIV